MRQDQPPDIKAFIEEIFISKSPLNKYHLLNELKTKGIENCTTSDINRVLYGHRNVFEHDGQSLPNWRLKAGVLVGRQDQTYLSYHAPDKTIYQGHPPRSWQTEALSAWISQGKRGVIEAVTGTGKSLVGILAAADALSRGLKVLIIVPGIELQKQWHDNIKKNLPSVRAGLYGNGNKDTFTEVEVVVATVQSARKYQMLPLIWKV